MCKMGRRDKKDRERRRKEVVLFDEELKIIERIPIANVIREYDVVDYEVIEVSKKKGWGCLVS